MSLLASLRSSPIGSWRGLRSTIDVQFTGDRELDAKFKAMPESVQKKGLRKACREVAKLTKDIAKQYAPHATGALEQSLTVKAAKRSRRNKHRVVVSVTTREGMYAGNEYYAGFLEFGTVNRQTKSGKSTGQIAEHKFWFLRPGLIAFVSRKRQMFMDNLRAWMLSEAAR